jgi:hypothetical protein
MISVRGVRTEVQSVQAGPKAPNSAAGNMQKVNEQPLKSMCRQRDIEREPRLNINPRRGATYLFPSRLRRLLSWRHHLSQAVVLS